MYRRQFLQGLCAGGPAVSRLQRDPVSMRNGYEPIGYVDVPNATEAVVGPDAEVAYVATQIGFAIVDIADPASPSIVETRTDLLADQEGGPLSEILDVAVHGEKLLVVGPGNDHEEPSLEGVLLYDVSDPRAPERIEFYETEFPIHNSFLSESHAYLVNSSQLVILELDDGASEVGRWQPSDDVPAWAEVHPLLRFAHDVFVRDGLAFVVEWDAGTFIVDVSDPSDPRAVTRVGGRSLETLRSIPDDEVVNHSLSMPGNHHTSMVNEDGSLLVVNKEAWETSLTAELDLDPLGEVELWDVSDVEAPSKLATIEAPNSRDPRKAEINTTPHNFDIRGERLYSSWYDGGVKIHDISDPTAPELLAWWRAPERWSFWTAQYATEEFFVSSSHSRGRYNAGKGAVVLFPNEPGQQASPPALTQTEPPTTTETATPDATPTSDATGTAPPDTATEPETGDTAQTGAETEVASPGFGVLTALGGVALGARRFYRNRQS